MILEAPAPPPAPARSRLCPQRVDLGGPIAEVMWFERHDWIIDRDEFDLSKYLPATVTRTYRCVRCGETWTVTGEPSPSFFTG